MVGVVSLGGIVLFTYLVVNAVSNGPLIFIIATVILMVFGAPVFVLGLLAATWKPGVWRAIRRIRRPWPSASTLPQVMDTEEVPRPPTDDAALGTQEEDKSRW